MPIMKDILTVIFHHWGCLEYQHHIHILCLKNLPSTALCGGVKYGANV